MEAAPVVPGVAATLRTTADTQAETKVSIVLLVSVQTAKSQCLTSPGAFIAAETDAAGEGTRVRPDRAEVV